MDLTRRGLIGRALAASGALLSARALRPGVVFAGEDGELVFHTRLPRSGRIRTDRPFELIAVEAPAEAAIEVRALGADGRWSEWMPAHAGRGHGPDARDADARDISDPVWTGPAHVFEVRARRPLHGARVVLVDSGAPARAAAHARYVDAGLTAGPGQPAIIARSTWATAACRPRVPAVFGDVELAFVHHTVSSNAYRPAQSGAIVRAICLFHKYGNGWNDIGYNFVVDRFGQVFEARAGGIDEAIVGAQAGGYNVYSTGVALLGNFSYGGPPRGMFETLAHLLAWKLAIHGIQLPGRTTVQVTTQGAPYSRYRARAHVTLNRISGHRDADTTACPGNGMYRQLPRLRQVVRRLAGVPSSLTLALDQVAPASVTVSGLLTTAGVGVGGATVELQRRSTTNGPQAIATTVTNPDGTWSLGAPLASTALLRAVFRGDPAHDAIVSAGIRAAVAPQIALGADTQQIPFGGVVQFSGSIAPPKPRVTLAIAQQQPDGTFVEVRTVRFGTNPDGTFTRTIGFPAAGQYQVVAHTAADDNNALGTSPPVAVAVA